MSIKKVLDMFLIFSVMEHVEIKFNQAGFWKMRELSLYTVCQLIVTEKNVLIQQNVFKL